MRASLFLVLLTLAVAAYAQNIGGLIPYLTLDDFSVGAGVHRLRVSIDSSITVNDPPQSAFATFTEPNCDGLIGCSRDMFMTVTSASAGIDPTSNIFPVEDSELFVGEWGVSNPKNARTQASLQYDGPDESADLDLDGLGGVDMTIGGTAAGLRFTVISDLDTNYEFELFSPNGGRCEATVPTNQIVGDDYDLVDIFVFIDFDDFDGNCDLRNIGAVQINLPSQDALDAIVRSFRIVGPVVSPSNTPTPAPSPSSIPSASPSPPVECMCHCPIFTCALIFDPDDDENNAYYFDDDDERAGLRPPVPGANNDDDDGQIVIPNVDDDEDDNGSSSNSATGLIMSAALVAVASALAI